MASTLKLPYPLILGGHCSNWPNVNIIISQGIGGPKIEMGTAALWSSENTHLSLKFTAC